MSDAITISETIELIRSHGFLCNWKREIYSSITHKKVFSYEFLYEKLTEDIAHIVSQPNEEWQFYFMTAPSEKLKSDIIKEIEDYAAKYNSGLSTQSNISPSI